MKLHRTVAIATVILASIAPARLAVSQSSPALKVGPTGVVAQGIRSLSGADGVTEIVRRGEPAVSAIKPASGSGYLYFAVEQPVSVQPIYVLVAYFDEVAGPGLRLDYDSRFGDTLTDKFRPAEEQAGGWTSGIKRWKWAAFRLDKPRFAHRQNLGADFRLVAANICVAKVHIESVRPSTWQAIDRIEAIDVKPLVKIGVGGQLIVGGFDPARATDSAPQARALEGAIPALKSLGVTSHEGYVRWNLCEPKEGVYDWSVYDGFVAVYKRHGLKWVPFLIVGSAYSLPDWYNKKPGSQGYVCLEHGQESDVQSLWNPVLKGHIERFIKAFCEHYRGTGVIESILLGITGNYGEAIYPVTGNDWTADTHGPYHSHPGFWAGDKYATNSFRIWLERKYGDSSPLREAWGARAPTLITVKPFLKKDAPNDRAWLDMCDWYVDSMTAWARFWLSTTRKHFPKGGIYLCTGGHAPPEHGADFGAQCKAAAESGAGVRITNEGSSYRANFTLTRWVASASRQYGAYFSFEPAGGVDANGVVARIYNATATGARGLHYYYPNLFDTDAARASFVRWGGEFKQRSPKTEIAVYYPETWIKLTGRSILRDLEPLRDRFDFSYVSDGQIHDGGLDRVKALVLVEGNTSEARTWEAILDWVRAGGLLVFCANVGELKTVEGDNRFQRLLAGEGNTVGRGRVITIQTGLPIEVRKGITAALATARELGTATRAMITADGKEDGVFATVIAPNSLLWLNYTNHPHTVRGVTLPPFSIVTQKVGADPRAAKLPKVPE